MPKRSKSQLVRRNQRRASPRVAHAKAIKRAPVRLRTKVFWIVAAGIYVVSILLPASMGLWVWMQVAIILVPLLAVTAFAVILGDQTPDGSIPSSSYSDSGGAECNSGADC
jgi:hypothetical protein